MPMAARAAAFRPSTCLRSAVSNCQLENRCKMTPASRRGFSFLGIDMKQRWGRKAQLVIEESPISHGLIQSLSEKHINVVAIKPDRDKRARLISQIDLFEGGSVLLPKDAPWLDAFVSELLSFPGRDDDQVDALTQGLAWRREAWKPPLVQRTTYGLGG